MSRVDRRADLPRRWLPFIRRPTSQSSLGWSPSSCRYDQTTSSSSLSPMLLLLILSFEHTVSVILSRMHAMQRLKIKHRLWKSSAEDSVCSDCLSLYYSCTLQWTWQWYCHLGYSKRLRLIDWLIDWLTMSRNRFVLCARTYINTAGRWNEQTVLVFADQATNASQLYLTFTDKSR